MCECEDRPCCSCEKNWYSPEEPPEYDPEQYFGEDD